MPTLTRHQCPDCLGFGWVILQKWKLEHGWQVRLSDRRCQRCQGTGQLVKVPQGMRPMKFSEQKKRPWMLPKGES